MWSNIALYVCVYVCVCVRVCVGQLDEDHVKNLDYRHFIASGDYM